MTHLFSVHVYFYSPKKNRFDIFRFETVLNMALIFVIYFLFKEKIYSNSNLSTILSSQRNVSNKFWVNNKLKICWCNVFRCWIIFYLFCFLLSFKNMSWEKSKVIKNEKSLLTVIQKTFFFTPSIFFENISLSQNIFHKEKDFKDEKSCKKIADRISSAAELIC